MNISVPITQLPHGRDLQLPKYASPGSAGLDLLAGVEGSVQILPGKTSAIPTGIAVALPDGYEAQVRPRSGLALNNQIGILNSPGTIDSDYRGEIIVLLTNFGSQPFNVNRGDRIAQMVITKYEKIVWQKTDKLADSSRDTGGFGSTGI